MGPTACDSSCGTCAGAANFCLTCANNQLAASGKCVTTCPSNSFSSSGSCVTCHPDCASCSGSSFNQCSSCPSDRPVLTNGRCLPTCSKSQFFDKTSSSCQTCDSSCSSCSGPGPSSCLACSSSSQVLRAGSCVSANCGGGSSSVIPGLGVCLSELVVVPTASGTNTPPPLPSITGIANPTVVNNVSRRPLEWWQILLMALGCAFIFLLFLMCWRRRARQQRAKRTAQFAKAKKLDDKTSWRWRLVRFGEKLFGHNASRRVDPLHESEDIKLQKLRDAEEARRDNQDLEKFIDYYNYSTKSRSSMAPSALPALSDPKRRDTLSPKDLNRLSGNSLYSHITGMPRHTPEPRQPVKKDLLSDRYSASTLDSSSFSIFNRQREVAVPPPVPKPATEAEAYVMAVRPGLAASPPTRGAYWLEPHNTGASSRNPFRQYAE